MRKRQVDNMPPSKSTAHLHLSWDSFQGNCQTDVVLLYVCPRLKEDETRAGKGAVLPAVCYAKQDCGKIWSWQRRRCKTRRTGWTSHWPRRHKCLELFLSRWHYWAYQVSSASSSQDFSIPPNFFFNYFVLISWWCILHVSQTASRDRVLYPIKCQGQQKHYRGTRFLTLFMLEVHVHFFPLPE